MAPRNPFPPGTQTLHYSELEEGMIVYGYLPSWLQTWIDLTGGLWRHTAIVAEVDGKRRVVGFGPTRKFHNLPVRWLAKRYVRVGAVKVFDHPAQAKAAAQWAVAHCGHPAVYPKRAVWSLLVLSLARRLGRWPLLRPILWLTLALVALHAAVLQVVCGRRPAFLCSSFILLAVRHAGRPQSLPEVINLLVPADDSRSPCRAARLLAVLIERWLVSPTDLWHAAPESCRFQVDLSPL